jgi:peptide chain release factor 2
MNRPAMILWLKSRRLEQQVEELELKALLDGPHDASGALLSVHARDGGVDANDWAAMLLQMYIAWAGQHDYSNRTDRPPG